MSLSLDNFQLKRNLIDFHSGWFVKVVSDRYKNYFALAAFYYSNRKISTKFQIFTMKNGIVFEIETVKLCKGCRRTIDMAFINDQLYIICMKSSSGVNPFTSFLIVILNV